MLPLAARWHAALLLPHYHRFHRTAAPLLLLLLLLREPERRRLQILPSPQRAAGAACGSALGCQRGRLRARGGGGGEAPEPPAIRVGCPEARDPSRLPIARDVRRLGLRAGGPCSACRPPSEAVVAPASESAPARLSRRAPGAHGRATPHALTRTEQRPPQLRT